MTDDPSINLTDPMPTVIRPDRHVFLHAVADLRETVDLREPADDPIMLRLHRLQWMLAVRLEETRPRSVTIITMDADRPWLEPVTRASRFAHIHFQWNNQSMQGATA